MLNIEGSDPPGYDSHISFASCQVLNLSSKISLPSGGDGGGGGAYGGGGEFGGGGGGGEGGGGEGGEHGVDDGNI